MKRCTKCKQLKVLDDFALQRRSADGRRPRCRKCTSEYYEQNKTDIKARVQRNYHKDIVRNRQKQRNGYRQPASLAWHQQYRQKHHTKLRAYQRDRKLKNPQQFAEYESRRRAKKKGAVLIEKISRLEIFNENNGCCHICKLPVPFRKMHLDHVIPLAKGGQHTRDNLKPAHPFCNMSKKDKLL